MPASRGGHLLSKHMASAEALAAVQAAGFSGTAACRAPQHRPESAPARARIAASINGQLQKPLGVWLSHCRHRPVQRPPNARHLNALQVAPRAPAAPRMSAARGALPPWRWRMRVGCWDLSRGARGLCVLARSLLAGSLLFFTAAVGRLRNKGRPCTGGVASGECLLAFYAGSPLTTMPLTAGPVPLLALSTAQGHAAHCLRCSSVPAQAWPSPCRSHGSLPVLFLPSLPRHGHPPAVPAP